MFNFFLKILLNKILEILKYTTVLSKFDENSYLFLNSTFDCIYSRFLFDQM